MRKSIIAAAAIAVFALAPPLAASPQGSGMFTGASNHTTSGAVTVSKQGGKYVIELGDDFSFDGAPDPYVALGDGKKPADGGLIAILDSNNGSQSYTVDQSATLDKATHVIIWCKKYAVPLGFAAIE